LVEWTGIAPSLSALVVALYHRREGNTEIVALAVSFQCKIRSVILFAHFGTRNPFVKFFAGTGERFSTEGIEIQPFGWLRISAHQRTEPIDEKH
jgi:hypothetical protein